MDDYNFSNLNDKEFEILANDLLSRHFNTIIDRFKPGPDQGIDGRFFSTDGDEVILQYKHYYGSGIKKLLYDLENKEVEKVRKLNPKRYIVATSVPLSPANKTKIKSIFNPFIQSESDIFGKENLNDILKKNTEIEKKHYKLWLSSTTVLENLLNKAINERSRSFLEDIKDGIKLYVETQKHKNALQLLSKSNVIIITGEPGVGKTTLAESLCLFFCGCDYDLCVIENSLNEAEAAYSSGKMVFYFDDFLGSNYLQALQQHQDTHIARFIQRVNKDNNKKFILTSRTNIFHRGISLSDKFKHKKIDRDEFVLSVNSLSDLEKAKILYNHMWFKGLPEGKIEQIYLNKRYLNIINHKNYNPRLIEYITDSDRLDNVDDDQYWDHIVNILDDPSEIWKTPFFVQSDEFMRNLVLLVIFNGRSITETELIQAYNKMNEIEGTVQNTNLSKSFELVIKSTVGFFLNRTILDKVGTHYSPFNPSVSDFLIKKYRNNIKKLSFLYRSISTAQSLRTLSDLHKNKKITEHTYLQVLCSLFEAFDIQKDAYSRTYDHFVFLSSLLKENNLLKGQYLAKVKVLFEHIILEPTGLSFLNIFVQILFHLLNQQLIGPIEKDKILKLIGCAGAYSDDLTATMRLIDYFEIDNEDIIQDISDLTHDYLFEALSDECTSIEINEFVDGGDEYGPSVDEDALSSKINNILQTLIDELEVSSAIYIDESGLCYDIDTTKLINDFFSGGESEWAYEEGRGLASNHTNSIDDLFDRSNG